MLAVEIQFLTGRYVATSYDDRGSSEWPPHPARFFSALVAEWGAVFDPEEEALLRHIETLGAPEIAAGEVTKREVVTYFVPVNDSSIIGSKVWDRSKKIDEVHQQLKDTDLTERKRKQLERNLAKALDVSKLVAAPAQSGATNLLPAERGKQARTFPSVTLEPAISNKQVVSYIWPKADLDNTQLATLDNLLSRVTRLGHSATLVSCRVISSDSVKPNYWPAETGELVLRTIQPGQLDALVSDYQRHQGVRPRSLPAAMTAYRRTALPTDPPVAATAGAWYIFEITPRISTRALANLTSEVREAILAGADEDTAADIRKAYILGLADIGHRYASGNLLGGAIVLPRQLSLQTREAILRGIAQGIAKEKTLVVGGQKLTLTRQPQPMLRTLQRQRWAGGTGTRTWVSATPAVIANGPKKRLSDSDYYNWVRSWLAESFQRSGLPKPVRLEISAQPLLAGTQPAFSYPPVLQAGRRRRLMHLEVEFDQPVIGPLLVGGGAHLGFGLMFPIGVRHD